MLKRREFCKSLALAALAPALRCLAAGDWKLHYILSSPMYGTARLEEILPEVRKTGAEHIDIWPAPHGNQREQVDQMGLEQFAALLQANQIKLGAITRYGLGPFGLKDEMPIARKLGAKILVTGSRGPKDAKGAELKTAVRSFLESMKPHAQAAGEQGLDISIENHAGSLLASPDSIKYFAEMATFPHIGIAFAPHHLPQDAALQAALIDAVGPKINFFYAQQEGKGSKVAQPIEIELLQMPGRGFLDFGPLLKSLKKADFTGWTSIYMHPVPRGRSILPTVAEVTAEINRSRDYLDKLAAQA